MKRLFLVLVGFGIVLVGFGIAIAPSAALTAVPSGSTRLEAPKAVKILIRHQARGCHTWSVDGSAFRAAQSLRLAPGGTITIANNDVMPQQLVKKSGPAVRYLGNPAMNHMGASVKVTVPKAGVYVFTTKAGEDYPAFKTSTTVGEDNVLTLKVTVA